MDSFALNAECEEEMRRNQERSKIRNIAKNIFEFSDKE